MSVLAIVLICLTCASYGGRLQTPIGKVSDADISNPTKALASLLEVFRPAGAFHFPPTSIALGRSRTANTAISNRARSPNMQYSGGSSWNKQPAWRTPAHTPAGLEKSEAPEAVETTDVLASEKAVAEKAPVPKKVETKRVPTPTGPFAPAVLAAKRVMGEQELTELRADIIRKHTKVISDFIDTSESKFGQLVLKKMFEAADTDNSGTLDKQEVREALDALGFTFLKDKEVDRLVKKADADKNEVIDFEEFVKETPKALRVNLVKLAKSNGHDLGFLA